MTAKGRRRIHFAVALAWFVPGAVLSFVLRESLAWVVFMSWFACWYSAMSAWAAETPVEEEDR